MPANDLEGDGRRHDTRSELGAVFMFGLLDYETWNIYAGPRWIGQVTINTADNSAEFTAGDDFSPAYTWMQATHLRGWQRWLQAHRISKSDVRPAF